MGKRSSLANLSQVPFRLSFKRCSAQNSRHHIWPAGSSTTTLWTHVCLCHWFYLPIPDTAVMLGALLLKKTSLCPTGEQTQPIPENRMLGFPSSCLAGWPLPLLMLQSHHDWPHIRISLHLPSCWLDLQAPSWLVSGFNGHFGFRALLT